MEAAYLVYSSYIAALGEKLRRARQGMFPCQALRSFSFLLFQSTGIPERLLLETGYVCPLYFTGQSSRLSSAYTGLLTDGIGGYYFSYVVQQNNG